MHNIMMTLQYDGTKYLGWTRPRKDGYSKTVSYRINTVLANITDEPVCVYAGAHTDPGIHALAQCISFCTDSSFSPEELLRETNRFLPSDIKITSARAVPERFRADLNALKQIYEYRICTAPVYDIFTSAYTEHIFPEPDIRLMEKAAELLTGTHDFRFFSKIRGKKKTEKTIEEIRFIRPENDPNMLIISITANDFLCRMPSSLTAVLLEIGTGKRKPESINDIFTGTDSPSYCSQQGKEGAFFNTKGLLLKNIIYQ